MMVSSAVTRLQGVYYVATGVWSLVHYRSFEAMSGRKHDRWLVRTVGLLAVAVGIGLVRHAGSRPGRELADTSAASFAIADLLAVSSGQGRVYLADAAVEWLLIAARHFGGRPWSRPTAEEDLAAERRRGDESIDCQMVVAVLMAPNRGASDRRSRHTRDTRSPGT